MAYMSRLGIWGTGTQFPSFQDFIKAVERRCISLYIYVCSIQCPMSTVMSVICSSIDRPVFSLLAYYVMLISVGLDP